MMRALGFDRLFATRRSRKRDAANFLKGMEGDAINALLCGVGHNLRKSLARLRVFLRRMGAPRKVVQGLLVRLEAGESPRHALSAA